MGSGERVDETTIEALPAVLVSGDVILDNHIYEGRRNHYGDTNNHGVRTVTQTGGAALVYGLLNELLSEQPESNERVEWQTQFAFELTNDQRHTGDTSQSAYAFWRTFPNDDPIEKRHWRVSEAMGFGAVDPKSECPEWAANNDLPLAPEIIVLSEGGMGFRKSKSCWEKLNFEQANWIVLKTSAPLFEGELWDTLSKQYADKLVLVMSANELRQSTARISTGLSWEESLENLNRDLDGNLAQLRNCRHLFVAFGSEGGVWFDFGPVDGDVMADPVHFVYDASAIEGDHEQCVRGTAFGFLSCLTAAVAWQLTAKIPDFKEALEGGLSAMRDLREKGHGSAITKPHGFPANRLADVIKVPTYCYSKATISGAELLSNPDWSFLRLSLGSTVTASNEIEQCSDLARLVVRHGPIALGNLPHLSVGKLFTVDRRESESLRTLSQVVRRYRNLKKADKPLSLGVFGPPGAGKSFAVKQLAKTLDGNVGWMEFNLSQFNPTESNEDLIGAFHQIRDSVLDGQLPVAFFDEFDSQSYRWLQFLLAPMQDGKFQEGQLTHSLGKCIFIFAGGTSWTFETLGPPNPADADLESEDERAAVEEYRKFRLAKGPDFKSRLDGFLDVIGPNQRKRVATESKDAQWRFEDDPDDIWFPIRRALMIRGGLGCDVDQVLEIDDGLLHALLNTPTYTHGSRSLNKVIQPLKTAMPNKIHRSFLAPRGQLDMHTDAAEFLGLLEKAPLRPTPIELSDDEVTVIARAIHTTWNNLGLRVGWHTRKTMTEYDDLGKEKEGKKETERLKEEFLIQSNRAAAERMPRILGLVNLCIVDAVDGEHMDDTAVRQHIEYHLELLAQAEHAEWMSWHFDQKWQHGPKKDFKTKTHHCLVPYRKLPHHEKYKDRTQVRSYPDFAAKAGKRIVFDD